MLRDALSDGSKRRCGPRTARTSRRVRMVLAGLKDRDIAARGNGNTDGISETGDPARCCRA